MVKSSEARPTKARSLPCWMTRRQACHAAIGPVDRNSIPAASPRTELAVVSIESLPLGSWEWRCSCGAYSSCLAQLSRYKFELFSLQLPSPGKSYLLT